ncbi:pyridoxamine 5'-phosphate oxidase family protein [Natrinema gelatinilyticum]|nr:pyridoxamine 5'-phosphate oxidase family protein [Natrinema gelatinilyticum]
MREAHDYWVTTIRPDGSPYVRPTWGVWVRGTFHCSGGERTQ